MKFFPEDLPATVSDNLAALSVKDLLTLSIGHATDSTPLITQEQNWVKAFLSLPIEHTPGSAFLYDSGGSYGTLTCRFDGDAVSISFPPPEAELLLTGRMSPSL